MTGAVVLLAVAIVAAVVLSVVAEAGRQQVRVRPPVRRARRWTS
jgi:hypothetical protein